MHRTFTSELTAEQRFTQVASLLAQAVLRYKRSLRVEPTPEKELVVYSPERLEVADDPRLNGPQCFGV